MESILLDINIIRIRSVRIVSGTRKRQRRTHSRGLVENRRTKRLEDNIRQHQFSTTLSHSSSLKRRINEYTSTLTRPELTTLHIAIITPPHFPQSAPLCTSAPAATTDPPLTTPPPKTTPAPPSPPAAKTAAPKPVPQSISLYSLLSLAVSLPLHHRIHSIP